VAGRGRLLLLLVAAAILNYADRQIIALLKPTLSADLGWSDQDYGNLTAVFQGAAALAFIFAGRLVDRIGLSRANPLAVGSWSVAAMLHGAATRLPEFFAARILLGATEALGTPAAVKTIAAAFAPRQRTLALGILNAANSLGAILAPLVVPLVAVTFGWRAAFLTTGGLGLVWVVCWYAAVPPSLPEGGATPARAAWGDALRDRRTWAIAGAKACSDQVWWFLLYWAPDFFHRIFGLSSEELAVPVSLIYVAAAAGALIGGAGYGRLAGRLGAERARLTVFLLCGLAALPAALAPHVGDVRVAMALLALILAAHQSFSSNLFGLLADIVPAGRVGLVTGIGALSGNLAGMAVLKATGAVLGGGGSYGPLFAVAGSSYLVALLWLRLVNPSFTPAGEAA
jgi:ACS family hexuronate transporter-like MFS transporter